MNATIRYNAKEVQDIVLAYHTGIWPTPEGHTWHVSANVYGCLDVKVELVEEKAEEDAPIPEVPPSVEYPEGKE